MSLTLDPQTEQRIQQETARGHYRAPADLINRALAALAYDESWSEEKNRTSGEPRSRKRAGGEGRSHLWETTP